MRRFTTLLAIALLALGLGAAPRHLVSRTSSTTDFVHFESGHVRPAAMTPDGSRLLVVNTPDNRLSVFDLAGPAPVRIAEIPVGLEPVSVAALSDNEAWVVNHLSDDVSVVDLATRHVRATLRVGDEPSDVVFAGAGPRAYVSVSQEDVVKVYDPATLAQVATIPVHSRFPRALARNADGSRVYVAGFHAGNRTSVLSEAEVAGNLPPPNPPKSPSLPPAPNVSLIIQQQAGIWRDEINRNWNAVAQYSVHDADVTHINTATNAVVASFGDIATVNFAIAVGPNGTVALTGTEARNLVRFEPNLRGHNVDTRVGYVTSGGAVTVGNLNPHINYAVTPGPQAERDSALGVPSGVAWSSNGQRVYVTSLASDRLALLDPSSPGTVLTRRPIVAGPTGVVVDDARGVLYVVGRFRNQLQTLSSANFHSVAVTPIGMDPTPDEIVNGRKFFYGGFTSGHGDQSCATCHVGGDFDNIAWDLGNPQGTMQPIDTTGQVDPTIDTQVHPMKGPMTTQSLRGLPNTGMFHWRADRKNLAAFNPAFVGLMGRATQLPDSEMTAFSDFVLPLVHPPNPRQNLDRSMPGDPGPSPVPSAKRGQDFFMNFPSDGGVLTCNQCHTANNFGTGTNGQIINNQALQESQDMKVPQLRNMYRKTGFVDQSGATGKRGFGFIHDGSIDNLFNFLKFPGFVFGPPATPQAVLDATRRDVEQFLLAFDTGMAPAVGFQITFRGPDNDDAGLIAQMNTLEARAAANDCDLIAKGRVGGTPRGWLYQGGGMWKPDLAAQPAISSGALRALGGAGSEVTVTGVPKGSGQRMGIDRDRDGFLDGDEIAAGSDPGNPASTPQNVAVAEGRDAWPGIRSVRPNPFRSSVEVWFALGRPGRVECRVHDLLGREVRVLAAGQWFEAGPQRLAWDGSAGSRGSVPAGVYFVRLRTDEGSWSRMVIRIR